MLFFILLSVAQFIYRKKCFSLKIIRKVNKVAYYDKDKILRLLKTEEEKFTREHSGSKELFEKSKVNYIDGVPMLWMVR